MRVVVFGTANTGAGYPRLDALTRGLQLHGADVAEVRIPLFESHRDKVAVAGGSWARVAKTAPRLCRVYAQLAGAYRRIGAHDAVLVGGVGHLDVLWFRRLRGARRVPLVFDPFVGLYDTVVGDRGLLKPASIGARTCLALDKRACHHADRVLVDTDAMARFYAAQVGLPREHFHVVRQAQDDRVFCVRPQRSRPDDAIDVVFAGTYVPLQGAEWIVRAAEAVRDPRVRITLIGDGQARERVQALARELGTRRVHFETAWLDTPAFAERIARADVCLGIFGTSDKSGRVIPLKAVASLAVGRPLITRWSDATEEVLTDGVDCLLVPPGDPRALAASIDRLAADPTERDRLGAAGRSTFDRVFSPRAIGEQLIETLEELLGSERRCADAVVV